MKNAVGKRVHVIRAAVLSLFLMLGMGTWVQAAGTVSVTADNSTLNISDKLTVNVQTSEPEDAAVAPEITVTYDPSLLSFESCNVEYGGGGGGLITLTGTSAEITFTAAATGNASVSAEAVIDEDGNNPATGSANVVIGASSAAGLSSDATLRALSMDPGTMSPEFDPNVTDYTITVEDSVTDITVSGGVSDETAQITAASGFKNLKAGTNQAVITVTAADGSTLTYHFTIQRGEETAQDEENAQEEPDNESTSADAGSLEFAVGETVYTVSETFGGDVLPKGCTKISVNYKGHEIDAASFDAAEMKLIYAVSTADASGEFFIYDETQDPSQLFIQLMGIDNRFIVPLQAQEDVPDGFIEENMQWNNVFVPAAVLADASVDNADSYYLLYAVNSEGTKGFYLYDAFEGTYQRFLNYGMAATGTNTNERNQKTTILLCVFIFLLVCAIMAIINLIIRNRELKAEYDVEDGEEKESREPKTVSKAIEKKKTASTKLAEKKPAAEKKPVAEKKSAPEKKPAAEKKSAPEKKPAAEKKPAQRKVIMPQTGEIPASAPAKETAAVKKEVTPQGVTYTTGEIPITIVQPPKAPVRPQKAVPIFTLERQPVPLTREAPPDELDDDFEFEFINIDNE